jgi:glycosyltransferase involved in cell wall biosynthesis
MKQIKLLFDAAVIVDSMNSKTGNRSGIYWVAYNILHQFSQCQLYQITLFLPSKTSFSRNNEHSIFLASFPFITLFKDYKYINNIQTHKNRIKNTKNIFFIFILFLKIIKNIFFLLLSKSLQKSCNDFDVFFSPVFSIPREIKKNTSIKLFHVLYDCVSLMKNVPHQPVDPNYWYIKMVQELNNTIYYFCISECTKNDFLKLFPNQLDETKMYVTPISTSQKFYPNYDKSNLQKIFKKYDVALNKNDFYIFSLCNIDPRKNLFFTMKCYVEFIKKHNINNLYFILGGASFPGYEIFLNKISGFAGYQDKIIQLGYVDDEDVNILYSNSLFFTYLSQYEGFGLPPLEAMQAGTPVICSNNSSLPEVVGDAAITIDYDSEEQCLKAFEDLYFNEDLRKYYIEKGLERAKLFSWEKTSNLMSKVIIDVTNTKSMK